MKIKININKSRIKELKNTIRTNVSNHKKFLIIISLIFIGIICFYLFTPIYIMNLILGIGFVFLGFDYITNKKRKGKKKKSVIFLILLIITVYIGSFVAIYSEERRKENSLIATEDSADYEESREGYRGENYDHFYETEFKNRQGESDPTGKDFKVPESDSLWHWVRHREAYEDIDETVHYYFRVYTNLLLANVKVTIWGSNGDLEEPSDDFSPRESDIDDDPLAEIDLILNKSDDNWYDFMWFKKEIAHHDVDQKSDYFFFLVEGKVAGVTKEWYGGDKSTNTRLYIEVTNVPLGKEENEWGFTGQGDDSTANILQFLLGDMYVVVIIATSILLVFIIMFLLMFVTGTLKQMFHFLMLLTMAGIVCLFVLIIIIPNIPMIAWIFDLIAWIPNLFGIGDILRLIMLMVTTVIALMLWTVTIGSALIMCWFIWYILSKYLDFAEDIEVEDVKRKD